MSVFTRRLTHKDECRKTLLKTETSKKPIIKLTISTLISRSKIAFKVFICGSLYLSGSASEVMRMRKRKKSTSVQLIAIMQMIGSFRLLTTDPLGTISFEKLMDDK